MDYRGGIGLAYHYYSFGSFTYKIHICHIYVAYRAQL